MDRAKVLDAEGNLLGEVKPGENLLAFAGRALVYRALDLVRDLSAPVPDGAGEVMLLDFEDPDAREAYWHTGSHILAQAVKEVFPETMLAIGPPVENGFYYDFDIGDRTFSPEDLKKIEEKAREIIGRDLAVERLEMNKEEALKLFKGLGERYKVELIREIPDPTVSVYRQGDFQDLCRGPHLSSTGAVANLVILSASGSYWRGDERGPRLQRIYGIAFPAKEQMDEFLSNLEEARKRDHRRLGVDLDLFSFHEEAGPGIVFWHPRGELVRNLIEDYWKRVHAGSGYTFVRSPHLFRSRLWEISGHMGFYRENMYVFDKDEETYVIKPMNCPAHILIYKSATRSYRDLPMRMAELGTVYRYERSGTLHGLFRVRGFTQDDAHIFCTQDQFVVEVRGALRLMKRILNRFGFFDFVVNLSTRDPKTPEKYMGDEEGWELAERGLAEALEAESFRFKVDPGEAVFYGPKIDVQLLDAFGRKWQCTTIQVDFNIPSRFDVTYVGIDGIHHRVVMIHRAILGSVERFFGVLVEHYGGNFPLWLAPVQAVVLPVISEVNDYASKLANELQDAGFRVEVDDRPERISYKIRDAETHKIPYMLVVGKKEASAGTVSVRRHGKGDLGVMPVGELLKAMEDEISPEEESRE